MAQTLLSRYVFLDTTEFDASSFNFQSSSFRILRIKSAQEQIHVLITEVVAREVESHVVKYAENSRQLVERFLSKSDSRFLKHLASPPFAQALNASAEEIAHGLRQGLSEFMEKAKVEVVGMDHVSTENVIDLYFRKLPPFGEEKKKSEFPDAISLLALKDWCDSNDERVYVVSRDGDVQNFCEREESLIYVPTLNDFLQLVELHESAVSERILGILRDHEDEIKGKIVEEFKALEFVSTDWDLDADIDNVNVDHIEILRASLIDVSHRRAEYTVKASIDYSAEVSQLDMDTAYLDKEEGILIPWDRMRYVYRDMIETEVDMVFSFSQEPETWDDLDLEELDLDKDIIELDLTNYDPYGE